MITHTNFSQSALIKNYYNIFFAGHDIPAINFGGMCAALSLEYALQHKTRKDAPSLEEISFVQASQQINNNKEVDIALFTRLQSYQINQTHQYPLLLKVNKENAQCVFSKAIFQNNNYIGITFHHSDERIPHIIIALKDSQEKYRLFDSNLGEHVVNTLEELNNALLEVLSDKQYNTVDSLTLESADEILNHLSANKYGYKFIEDLSTKIENDVNLESLDDLPINIIKEIGTLVPSNIAAKILIDSPISNNASAVFSILYKALITQNENLAETAQQRLQDPNMKNFGTALVDSHYNINEIKHIIESYADKLSEDHLTMLHFASQANEKIASIAMSLIPEIEIYRAEPGRISMFEKAIYNKQLDIAKAFIDKTSPENLNFEMENYNTPLTMSMQYNMYDLSQYILEKMPPHLLTQKNQYGATPIIEVIKYNNTDTICTALKLISEPEYEIHKLNKNGYSAFDIAKSNGINITEVLENCHNNHTEEDHHTATIGQAHTHHDEI